MPHYTKGGLKNCNKATYHRWNLCESTTSFFDICVVPKTMSMLWGKIQSNPWNLSSFFSIFRRNQTKPTALSTLKQNYTSFCNDQSEPIIWLTTPQNTTKQIYTRNKHIHTKQTNYNIWTKKKGQNKLCFTAPVKTLDFDRSHDWLSPLGSRSHTQDFF